MLNFQRDLKKIVQDEDVIDFDGFSDLPWPFEYLKEKGIQIVAMEENVGGGPRIKTFYKTIENIFYAVCNLPAMPFGYSDYDDVTSRALQSYLKRNTNAGVEEINQALAHYQEKLW